MHVPWSFPEKDSIIHTYMHWIRMMQHSLCDEGWSNLSNWWATKLHLYLHIILNCSSCETWIGQNILKQALNFPRTLIKATPHHTESTLNQFAHRNHGINGHGTHNHIFYNFLVKDVDKRSIGDVIKLMNLEPFLKVVHWFCLLTSSLKHAMPISYAWNDY